VLIGYRHDELILEVTDNGKGLPAMAGAGISHHRSTPALAVAFGGKLTRGRNGGCRAARDRAHLMVVLGHLVGQQCYCCLPAGFADDEGRQAGPIALVDRHSVAQVGQRKVGCSVTAVVGSQK
jgi:hypothetical protein